MARSVIVALVAFGVMGILALVFALTGGPQILTFWPLESAADFAQRVTPLFVIALFVERAIEVFITPWRTKDEPLLKVAKGSELGNLLEREKVVYKCETQRIAFAAAVSVGVVVSAVGIRALALFIYPDQIEALTGWQASLFTSVDVLVTGAVIGGGADGIHKIIKVFTTLFDTTSARLEAQTAAPRPDAVKRREVEGEANPQSGRG